MRMANYILAKGLTQMAKISVWATKQCVRAEMRDTGLVLCAVTDWFLDRSAKAVKLSKT